MPFNTLLGLPPDPMRWPIAGTALAMFALGLWNDFQARSVKLKLAGQVGIASAAYLLGLGIHHFKIPLADRIIDLGGGSWPVTVLWLVALTNLINFLDQADGLAGGVVLMLMLLLSVVGAGTEIVAVTAAGLAGALLAFLRFNFPPAKIHLGSGGTYFLGFLIGALTIDNSHKGSVVAALVAPLFVLALPILDTALAMLRRGLHGLPLFRPDGRCLPHRLRQSGWSRRGLTLGAYVFTAFFSGLGLAAYWWRGQYLAVVLGGAAVSLLLIASQFGFSREWFKVGTILEKSLNSREDVQYALDQSRWLAMEGARGRSLQGICDDAAVVARKLGFARMRIQLEDGEQVWAMTQCDGAECSSQANGNGRWRLSSSGACRCHVFRHPLPGYSSCYVELQTPDLNPSATRNGAPVVPANSPDSSFVKFEIVGEVLAEGWAKSVADWRKQNKLPIRFNPLATLQPAVADRFSRRPKLAADAPQRHA